MIKLFRGIRQTLLKDNKFSKYLMYAIGEIVLVVIGILIALSINNWNDERSESARLSSIYQTIQRNLMTDTSNIARVIVYHEMLDELIDRQLSGELTDELIAGIDSTSFKNCLICQPLNSTYETFYPQKKGISLLQNFADNHQSMSYDLNARIVQFYSEYPLLIEEDMERIEALIMDNIKEFEKQEWYVDIMFGRYNPEMLDFVKNNLHYRNSTVSFKMMSTENYLRNLMDYREEANELLEELDTILERNK